MTNQILMKYILRIASPEWQLLWGTCHSANLENMKHNF
jgi:hypothetical protein